MILYIIICLLLLLVIFLLINIQRNIDKKFLKDITRLIKHNLYLEKEAKDEVYYTEMLRREYKSQRSE